MGLYVQYGCGLTAPTEWVNYDISPTLRLQRIPLLGVLLKNKWNAQFPKNVKYGDIIGGLPGIKEGTCDGIYCSHVLEHLSLADFRKALQNTYRLLKDGGTFRCVLPDLKYYANRYLDDLKYGNQEASINFMKGTNLGMNIRPKSIRDRLVSQFGNSRHLWMRDKLSLPRELFDAGFREVRECKFNDSPDEMFALVENEGRFRNALAFEAIK